MFLSNIFSCIPEAVTDKACVKALLVDFSTAEAQPVFLQDALETKCSQVLLILVALCYKRLIWFM